ncbi:MAG: YdcH family protein [Zoogloeaceae bacterium]|jgi:hypothetical protein|nr:YdcH family protein [Zoogloeaceae bacterium]
MNSILGEEESERYRQRLAALRLEHRDLDQVITHLVAHLPADRLLIPRLKKRRLQLRDQIEKIEMLLAPDESA